MESLRDKGEARGEINTGLTEGEEAKSVTDFGTV
jgi:hypothetical protein